MLNKSKYLNLKRLHRDFKVTFPLTEIGFIADHDCKTTQGDKGFELCLRLSSETKYSNDIIGDTRYQLRFPNVFLKVPGVWRQISVEGKRDAVFFKYDTVFFYPNNLCAKLKFNAFLFKALLKYS